MHMAETGVKRKKRRVRKGGTTPRKAKELGKV